MTDERYSVPADWGMPGASDERLQARANELLNQLTLDEKLGMMDGDLPFWKGLATMFGAGYGSQTWNAGVVDRLGIPGVRFTDGPRGVVMKGATTFPVSIARAATWDPALEEQIGDAIGKEVRAVGATLFGGVCINLARHPAWGRSQESYGEDPLLLGEMGAALAQGVQRHAMACVKHYCLNSMENARFTVDVSIDPRSLHEMYLPHFKRVVDAGVSSVMSAYNSVNGEWCGQNRTLLTEILKERWGFDGFVMTDFMFGMRDSKKAALAGQDIEMPFGMLHMQHLRGLVERGEVPLARIDDAVRRILREQLRVLLPGDYPPSLLGCAEHQALARQAAAESIVLLKNDRHALPLEDVSRLAVIGRLADTPNTGDAGSSNTQPDHVVTPLAGLRAALAGKAQVHYEDGSDLDRAQAAAQRADAAVVVVGYTHLDEGEYMAPGTIETFAPLFPPPSEEELPIVQAMQQQMAGGGTAGIELPGGDRVRLGLSPGDIRLICSVAEANPRTIVVIEAGSMVMLDSWKDHVPAILMLWYPGMEGGHALADVLVGSVSPGGKLPFVVPLREDQLPAYDKDARAITYDLWHGYRKLARDGQRPALPFGFGLGYTNFEYTNLRLGRTCATPGDTVQVMLDVTNTGPVAGEEVVQLYASAQGSSVDRAPFSLVGFQRVAVSPGETREVTITLPISRLAIFDVERDEFVVEPLTYQLVAGRHSLDQQALRVPLQVRT